MTKAMTDEEAALLACRAYDWDWPGILKSTDRIVIIGRLLADIDRLTRERDELKADPEAWVKKNTLDIVADRDKHRQEAERLRKALEALKADLENTVWPCDFCGREEPMTNADIYADICRVLAEGSTLYAEDGDDG